MHKRFVSILAFLTLAFSATSAFADAYSDTIDIFKKAGPERPHVPERVRLRRVPDHREGRA
jgi:hypothetical protein